MFGNAYLYPTFKSINLDTNKLFFLNTSKIEWDSGVTDKLDLIPNTNASYNNVLKSEIRYNFNNGTSRTFQLRELIPFIDTITTDNWYRGASRIDSLWNILYNVERGLKTKSISLFFAGRFFASGSYDPKKNLEGFNTLSDIERENVENKLMSDHSPVVPVKTQVTIERFVEDLAKLELDGSYESDLIKIGSIYNIPKELLDALKDGATYENQEKALARHVSYSEMPKGMDLIEGICRYFNLNPDDYEMSWDHLPYMQVFEKDRAEVRFKNAETLERLVSLGADVNEAAGMVGYQDLTFKPKNNGSNEAGNGE